MTPDLPLFVVTLDTAPFALVKAFDAVDAVDLAFGLFSYQWFNHEAANDGPVVDPMAAAREHLPRLAARAPTEAERHAFAVRCQEMPGVPLAAVLTQG